MTGRLTPKGPCYAALDVRVVALAMQVAVLALMMAGLGGCAAGQRGGMRGSGPKHGREDREIPPATLLILRATIVDLNPAAGTLTVKDDQTHGTWTVAVTKETAILGTGGQILALSEFQVGQKVRIRGTSRIEEVLTALEVERENQDR